MVTAISKRSRRSWPLVAVASIFSFVLATSASAHRSEFRPGKWPSHTVLIGYSSEQALETALRGRGARVVARVPSLRTVAVRPSGDAASFAADVSGASGIDFVQPPVPRHALVEPALAPASVPGGSYQWQYVLTGADRVPDRILRAASGVRIGIVDSGADLSAPDLEAKRPMTYNAIDNSSDVTDDVGHGTFVASLAAGLSSNAEGMAGIAGEARLITIKASSAGRFTDFELAAAIAFAVDNGAKIVNLSLGGPSASRTEVRALEYALTKDVLLVAAAGNEALEGNPVSYPAALLQPLNSNGVGGYGLSVGASTITGARANFSNHGSYISLAAPGEEVFGAISKDSSPKHFPRVALPGSTKGLYGYSSGTSFSAPQVAGAVIARSAPALVTLGQAKSVLTLTPFKFKEGGKRYSVVFAVLATDAPDVKLSRRIVRLEQFLGGKWRHVSYQWTDASGRVIWLVPRGRYTIRAIFKQSSELKAANSRALTVSGF